MQADRKTHAATIGGWFMLLVQLRVLHIFWTGAQNDNPISDARAWATLAERISWLKPRFFGEHALTNYVGLYSVLCGVLVIGLGAAGIVSWRRWRRIAS